jgi:hypothetical protein
MSANPLIKKWMRQDAELLREQAKAVPQARTQLFLAVRVAF